MRKLEPTKDHGVKSCLAVVAISVAGILSVGVLNSRADLEVGATVKWTPAWVEWRLGGGYLGWAPLAPTRLTVAIGAPQFVFVQTASFHERVRPSRVVVNNTPSFIHTTASNNIRHETRAVGGAGSQPVVVNMVS